MKKTSWIIMAAMLLIANAANASEILFRWVSEGGNQTINGGIIEQRNYMRMNCVNYKMGDYYTLLLLGKKANIEEEGTRNSTYLELTLDGDQVFHANDTIRVKAFRYGADSDKATMVFTFDNGVEIVDTCVWTDVNPPLPTDFEGGITYGAKGETKREVEDGMDVCYFVVPADADSTKSLSITRDLAEAFLFISELEVIAYDKEANAEEDEGDGGNAGEGEGTETGEGDGGNTDEGEGTETGEGDGGNTGEGDDTPTFNYDVNNDGKVDIKDVTDLVDYILEKQKDE